MSGNDSAVLTVKTRQRSDMVDLTQEVARHVPPDFCGLCVVFVQHTTAGITINENADPDVRHDLMAELDRLVPWRNPTFRHIEGNSAAHVKASLLGSSVSVPVDAGRLLLGTWQAIYFCEFDGPRNRRALVRLIAQR